MGVSSTSSTEVSPSRLVASIFALLAFTIGSMVAMLIIVLGCACWDYAHTLTNPEEVQTRLEGVGVAVGLTFGSAAAALVYMVCRSIASPKVIFHVTYGLGFMLLCFCWWLTQISMPLTDSWLVKDSSTQVLTPLLTAPLLCLILIPMGLLLLVAATVCDQRAPIHPGRWKPHHLQDPS